MKLTHTLSRRHYAVGVKLYFRKALASDAVQSEIAGHLFSATVIWLSSFAVLSAVTITAIGTATDNLPSWTVLVFRACMQIGVCLKALKTVVEDIWGAELLDSFLLRPYLLYFGSQVYGGWGLFLGGVLADAIYWLVVLRQRRKAKR